VIDGEAAVVGGDGGGQAVLTGCDLDATDDDVQAYFAPADPDLTF
jgi:hypothetical protein